MSRKERRRERTRQTYRLYRILKNPNSENVESEVLDCILRGADLRRRDVQFGLPIWFSISTKNRCSVVKILYDYGGLGEDIVIQNHFWWDKNEEPTFIDYTLEWVIAETFYPLDYPEEWENDEFYEYIISLRNFLKKRYEEYKNIFKIQNFDLEFIKKFETQCI